MKTILCSSLFAFLVFSGCSKVANDPAAKQDENQLKSASPDKMFQMYYSETYPNTPVGKLTAIPVMCDGEIIDHLKGTLDVHCRMFGHYAPDPKDPTKQIFVSQWMIHSYSGSFTSASGSGEVFDVTGTKKMDVMEKVFTFHLNMNGNMGNHYIVFALGKNENNPIGYTFTIEKAVCPGSN